ncbi:MAG: hypothetical protein HC800_02670 [Phormidesmis sp. RL_2_1]|nr:hypothetical protein [Phormidesmis sp. RL_2_1]
MSTSIAVSVENKPHDSAVGKHFKLIDRTYENNIASDYTEKIEALGKSFDYEKNSQDYWGEREFSTLYGTPFYEHASESQKRALNHLYWVGQYNHTANAEANTMLYNQVTTGVFAHLGRYEKLCEELTFETSQERFHINTFQRIGLKTKIALMGKSFLHKPVRSKKKSSQQTYLSKLIPKAVSSAFETRWGNESNSLQDSCLRTFNRMVHPNRDRYYSQYLSAREGASIPTATGGLAGNTASPSIIKFLTLSWGSSPFMACHYYTMRMVANISLKGYEYQYYKKFRHLERQGSYIPVPTSVSHYHLLDEAFHTTMSQVIAQDVYKDMPQPTAYEKWLANMIVLRGQKGVMGGLSGWLPMTFRDDAFFLPTLYRLLRSPMFELSHLDALYWMERCLCHEHEGFHANLNHHQNLLGTFQRFFEPISYLWSQCREVKPMVVGGSIERAIQRNSKAFKRFSMLEEQL